MTKNKVFFVPPENIFHSTWTKGRNFFNLVIYFIKLIQHLESVNVIKFLILSLSFQSKQFILHSTLNLLKGNSTLFRLFDAKLWYFFTQLFTGFQIDSLWNFEERSFTFMGFDKFHPNQKLGFAILNKTELLSKAKDSQIFPSVS